MGIVKRALSTSTTRSKSGKDYNMCSLPLLSVWINLFDYRVGYPILMQVMMLYHNTRNSMSTSGATITRGTTNDATASTTSSIRTRLILS